MNPLILRLLDLADELTEPRPHKEKIRVGWTKNRNPVFTTHQTIQQGLIRQLYLAAVDPIQMVQELPSRAKPKSRPPLALEALSAYEGICAGARRWVRSVGLEPRLSPERDIRALVSAAPRFDLDTLEALHSELRTWRRWAGVMSGWDHAVFRPRIECPGCETFGSIRVNGEQRMAFCNECQTGWEGPDLVGMAEKIRVSAA